MDRLIKISKELCELDARRVPGFGSIENMAFLSALDRYWPTIRGMLLNQKGLEAEAARANTARPTVKALSDVETSTLRAAASAWRNNAKGAASHWAASGPFKWFMPEPEMSIYDRVDEMVAEIERLRALTK